MLMRLLIKIFFGLSSYSKSSAIVPAIRYKAGTKLSASLHRVFHFYPASAGRKNFGQRKICQVLKYGRFYRNNSFSFCSSASPRKFFATIFPEGSIKIFCGIWFTWYNSAAPFCCFKSLTCVHVNLSA